MSVASAVLHSISDSVGPRSVLIAGSGPGKMKEWATAGYQETYLDIEPRTNPDVVASMTDMGDIGPFDIVFCSHALEHLYPHEVNRALCEFRRVLRDGGVAIILVPDLEGVAPTDDVLPNYHLNTQVTGLHLFYGDHTQIEEFPHMAHHCGFVASTMRHALELAGFRGIATERQSSYNLVGIGVK
jgi:predicted SAM-dependent methyltransferase